MRSVFAPCLALAVLLALLAPPVAADETPPADDPDPQPRESIDLSDPIEAFVPAKPRGGHESDRVRALALFAAARVAEQKQDFPKALRYYERAYRFDPASSAALHEIVPLAFNLDRQAEAVRYALIMAEHDPTDSTLLRRLAMHLTEEGDSARALKLYGKAWQLHEKEQQKPSASLVLLSMEMGRLYFVNKEYEKAAEHFRRVSKALEAPKEHGLDSAMVKALVGKTELTYQLFAEAFLEADKFDEAVTAFEKSNTAKPDEALHAFSLARVLARQKQYDAALAKLDVYLARHATSQGTAAYELLGDVLAGKEQKDQLLSRLEKLRGDDPDNVPLAYHLAQLYRQAGQLDKAEPIYAALVENRKERPPVEAFQGLVDIYRQQKDAAKLLAVLGNVVGRGGSLEPLGDSAKSLVADTELSKAVVALAAQQLAAEPGKASHGTLLAGGLLAIELEDFAAADVLFGAALAADKNKASDTVLTWGLGLFLANQFADAARVFQRGLDEKILAEDNAAVQFYLAGALEMSGRTDEAIRAAQKGAELKKDSPRFASRVAWIEYHAKRLEAAQKSYQDLLARFEPVYDSTEARDIVHEARLALSNISVQAGKLKESEEYVELVLDEFPEDVGALNDLGYLWADSGKHIELAHDMIQTAVAAEPDNSAYRDSLGWVLFRLGRFPEAVAELKTAAAGDDPDGTVLDHLAEAQFHGGDAPAAVETWNRAAQVFEKHAEAEKLAQTREKIARAQSAAAKK